VVIATNAAMEEIRRGGEVFSSPAREDELPYLFLAAFFLAVFLAGFFAAFLDFFALFFAGMCPPSHPRE
jgi:hypothetical protein